MKHKKGVEFTWNYIGWIILALVGLVIAVLIISGFTNSGFRIIDMLQSIF